MELLLFICLRLVALCGWIRETKYQQMSNQDATNVEEWYRLNYNRINASAVSDSLANKVLHKLIEKPFKSNVGLEILEVGANKGEHLKFVNPGFRRYVMTDIRPIENLTTDIEGGVESQVANVENLPFADKSFDRVISTCLFHHLENPIKGFEQIRRVTKVGGKISILIPNDPGIVYRALRSITTLRNAKKLNLFTEAQIIHAIEHRNHYLGLESLLEYVFKNDELETRSFPFYWRSYNMNALTVFEITVLSQK
jgi:phosphatidylethanolamine/phosphatidyl-N-methylethanolamine N-methyltransferase